MSAPSAARRDHLLGLLEAYVPRRDDPRDVANLSRLRAFLATREPFLRSTRQHVTASAVVIRPSDRSLLLVFHRKLGRWLQPGGHVEPEDATVFETARREVFEETGLGLPAVQGDDAILDLDVHPIPASGSEPPHEHLDVRFLLTAKGDAEAPAEGAAWFRLGDPAPPFPPDPDGSLSRAAAKALHRLGLG